MVAEHYPCPQRLGLAFQQLSKVGERQDAERRGHRGPSPFAGCRNEYRLHRRGIGNDISKEATSLVLSTDEKVNRSDDWFGHSGTLPDNTAFIEVSP